jgi:hypothetical protein
MSRKEEFFIDKEEMINESNRKIKMQRTIFSELKGVKNASKKSMLDWMELKIHDCDIKNYTIPRLGLRHHRIICKGLGTIFRELEEASKFANTLYPDK